MERESMDFDVVIVGGGPAGLSAAIKLAQLSREKQLELSICVLEKGAEIGAHILSGGLLETRALDELIPDWQQLAPVTNPVTQDAMVYLTTPLNQVPVPKLCIPKTLHNSSANHVISLANLCRWLAEKADALGVDIFPGFSAMSINYSDEGAVVGVRMKDMGLDKAGEKKSTYQAGLDLNAKYTLFAEGARGHLGKQLISHFKLNQGKQPQHYALGLKEIWQLPIESPRYHAGSVLHTAGWPLSESQSSGGGFVYHMEHNQLAVGLIVDLNYTNPYLNPFDEFQRFKHHPAINQYLQGAERIAFGARALAKGGMQSLPKQQFAGGLLIGCDAGTLNAGKLKGIHCAMKSGMIAAEAVIETLASQAITNEEVLSVEANYQAHFEASWLYEELQQTSNFSPAINQYGTLLGGTLNWVEQNIWRRLFRTKPPWNISAPQADYVSLLAKSECSPINYQRPDGKISFDRPSSLFLSGTQHEEDQPCHLVLASDSIPVDNHLPIFDEPSQRYCPAGVYEVIKENGATRLHINPSNCLHCKTCDIKDPSQNITWLAPEGGGGPGYQNM